LFGGNVVDGGLGAVITGGLVDGDDGFGLEFGDDVLDAAFAEAGEADEVDIAAAEQAHRVVGAGFALVEHEAIDGVLAGGEAVGDALDGAEADGAFGCYSSRICYCGIHYYR
jgi:hypothetical protein